MNFIFFSSFQQKSFSNTAFLQEVQLIWLQIEIVSTGALYIENMYFEQNFFSYVIEFVSMPFHALQKGVNGHFLHKIGKILYLPNKITKRLNEQQCYMSKLTFNN